MSDRNNSSKQQVETWRARWYRQLTREAHEELLTILSARETNGVTTRERETARSIAQSLRIALSTGHHYVEVGSTVANQIVELLDPPQVKAPARRCPKCNRDVTEGCNYVACPYPLPPKTGTDVPPSSKERTPTLREALTELVARCREVKAALDATVPADGPVHPQSAALTWPLSSAVLALESAVETGAPLADPTPLEDVWELMDHAEENAQTGEVAFDADTWRRLLQIFWDLGGRYEEELRSLGWSPSKTSCFVSQDRFENDDGSKP